MNVFDKKSTKKLRRKLKIAGYAIKLFSCHYFIISFKSQEY